MKRILAVVLFTVAVSMLGTNAWAQSIAQGKNDLFTDLFFVKSSPSNDSGEDITRLEWTSSYGRFLTDRVAVGPLLGIFKESGGDANGYVGGLVRYHFGSPSARFIPYAEVNASRTVNPSDLTDVEVQAGVVIPMGRSGGRFRVSPYYYKGFADEGDDFQSFGIKWGVGLLF